jgi:hypothetical protein
MLAAQNAGLGLPAFTATGDALASTASGPVGQALWSGANQLAGGLSQIGNTLKPYTQAATRAQRMMGLAQPQQQRQPPAPMQGAPRPQMAQAAQSNVPNPAQLAAYKRMLRIRELASRTA